MTQQVWPPSEDGLAPGTLAVLTATPAVLEALLGRQPEDALSRPGEEGWSPKDVLAHLISIQGPALVDRVRAMLDSDLPSLPNVDEHETLERSGLRDRPIHELLHEFAEQRARAVLFLERLGPEEMRRRGRHELAGEVTVADAIHHMCYHDLPSLPNVDEHETLERSGLRDRPIHELLHEFADQRARAMLFLERLGPEGMRRRGRHELAGEVTVADAIHHMCYHDLLHIAQISSLLAEPIEQRRGAMRQAFPV